MWCCVMVLNTFLTFPLSFMIVIYAEFNEFQLLLMIYHLDTHKWYTD